MFRKMGLLIICAALAGCFNAETGMSFREDATVVGFSAFEIDVNFASQMGGMAEFCEDGQINQGPSSVTCVTEEEMTLAEAIAKSNEASAAASMDTGLPEQPEFTLQETSPGEVLVVMPIGQLLAAGQEQKSQEGMPNPAAMMAMMGIDLTGREMKFWVVAPEILDSTETITDGGTRTEIVLPLSDVFAGLVPLEREFRVRLRYN
ncbi:MAG: hypothetical protein AAF198_04655 [Pseudomonadota bacterium]